MWIKLDSKGDYTRGMAVGHFDDDNADIHLDKEAVSGKYRIRVPLIQIAQ